MSKKAIARPYLRVSGRRDVRGFLSERTRAEFASYVSDPEVAATVTRAVRHYELRQATIGRVVCSDRVEQLARALHTPWLCSATRRWRYSQTLSADAALFYWASTVVGRRYAAAPTSESL